MVTDIQIGLAVLLAVGIPAALTLCVWFWRQFDFEWGIGLILLWLMFLYLLWIGIVGMPAPAWGPTAGAIDPRFAEESVYSLLVALLTYIGIVVIVLQFVMELPINKWELVVVHALLMFFAFALVFYLVPGMATRWALFMPDF